MICQSLSSIQAKPTTVEQLENLDKDIKDLEEFRAKNQRLQKLLAMALPFFIYPVLVWFIRKLLIFLFSKRTERNNDKLEDLKAAKKKILEEVMETETYKNAKLILERFDPEAKRKAVSDSVSLSHVALPTEPVPLSAPGGPPERSALSASVLQGAIPRTPCSPIPGVGPPLARPILPKDRGAVDRVIEYLVGDGPQNRYALICQQCFSHNGMALKEEFEYLAFRCAYCYFLNPARKTRPQAPRLPEFSYERRLRAESRSPGPTLRSGTDTEESAPPSGGTEKYRYTDRNKHKQQAGITKIGSPQVWIEKTVKGVCG
uniref:Endoplasmic reticulum junction formation protein lunapark n=1 Tax=Lates calcarifer TaxID=8187 RepID=A0A4W6BN93_LATCA